MIKPSYQNSDRTDQSSIQSVGSSNNIHKVANLFTNQLQSQQQQLYQQQQNTPNSLSLKYLTQKQDTLHQSPQQIYESKEFKQRQSPYVQNFSLNTLNSPQLISQPSIGRNQSPYSGNNSYVFSNGNSNFMLEKQGSSNIMSTINNGGNILQNMNSNYNHLNNSQNSESIQSNNSINFQFQLRDLKQERENMKMIGYHSGTEENSPIQLKSQDRFNLHRQRELSKISRQDSEDQNRKMCQTINELEGEWNKIKKNHNLDYRSQSPFNNSLNNSIQILPKISQTQIGKQRLSDQLNKDQWNTQLSDNNSIHDQSYDNTNKTQGSIKSLTSSCKRVRTQGESGSSSKPFNKIIQTPSRKSKDQNANSLKKTQIITKSIPLSKINLEQMRTSKYSSHSNGEQVTQYIVKKNDQKQNFSQVSNRNSQSNSNLSNVNQNNHNQHYSIQNRSPLSRNSSQDESNQIKSPDSTFFKIQEKYQNVHKQKPICKHQDSSNQSINLSIHQSNFNLQPNQQQLLSSNFNYNTNNVYTNSNSNSNLLNQQNSEGIQQYQKNSFFDLTVSPQQSQIVSQWSQQNINGCSTLHQYPSILSQTSTNNQPQTSISNQFSTQNQITTQNQQSSQNIQRYYTVSNHNNTSYQNFSSQNDLTNHSNNNDQQNIFQFNSQNSNVCANNIVKQPNSYINQNGYQNQTNYQHSNNNHSSNNSANNSFSLKQHKPNGMRKDLDQNQKHQMHSSPPQMKLQQQQPINFQLNQHYQTSSTAVTTPSCNSVHQNGQNPNRQSEQAAMIHQQVLFGLDQSHNNQKNHHIISQGGFTEAVIQTSHQNKNQQQYNGSNSKEKQIVQLVRASPLKKMISDVKPQIQQSPKQTDFIKGIQNNQNNSCINQSTQFLSGNVYGCNQSYGSNQYNQQPQIIQSNSGKKDISNLIMNKVNKMNIARISLNEEDDQFFQSTDADSYNQNSSGKIIPQINVKSKGYQNIDKNGIQSNSNNYYLQDIDHIQKTIQQQQQQQNQQQDLQYYMHETQSNNSEGFSFATNPKIYKDAVSPRTIPSFITQSSNDPNRNPHILQSQKFFQSNGTNDKCGNQKTTEQVYCEMIAQKKENNHNSTKESLKQQENTSISNQFVNKDGLQQKESFLIQQQHITKPYINSQNNIQQTPIHQKKVSQNTNFSQKLLDSIQKHAKIHQENQQNLYSSSSINKQNIFLQEKKEQIYIFQLYNSNDVKRNIGKAVNNPIKKSQIQSSNQQQQQQLNTQQVQLQLSPQLSSIQQQKVYNQALKSYQSSSTIAQSVQSNQISQLQLSTTTSHQSLPQKQMITNSNMNSTSTYNFNLNSPIAKKIY